MKRLLNQPDPSDPRSLRDKALCELLYATGLRVSEMAKLTVDDLDIENHSLRCFGKGSKERMVPAGKVALDYVALYLQQRKAVADGIISADATTRMSRRGRGKSNQVTVEEAKSAYLFPDAKGASITRNEIWPHRKALCGGSAARGTGHAAYPAPFVRHASAHRRGRSAGRAGASGPCEHRNDGNLYPRHERPTERRVPQIPTHALNENFIHESTRTDTKREFRQDLQD